MQIIIDNRLIELTQFMCSIDWDDEIEAESADFHLTQFQDTAFSSDYKFVKVTTKGEPLVSDNGSFPVIFVAKITCERERQTILEMNRLGIPVPAVYGSVTNGSMTVLYEELVDGREIYHDPDINHWTELARTLARVHSVIPSFRSEKTFERIRDARAACQSKARLKSSFDYALSRLKAKPPHYALP